MELCFDSNEFGDAQDMLTFVKQVRRTQETSETVRGEHFCEPPSMCGHMLSPRKHRRDRNTFCTCFWRGTAFSRRRPLPSPTAACSRALPLASNAVAFLLSVVTEHTKFCDAGIGSFPFSGTPRK